MWNFNPYMWNIEHTWFGNHEIKQYKCIGCTVYSVQCIFYMGKSGCFCMFTVHTRAKRQRVGIGMPHTIGSFVSFRCSVFTVFSFEYWVCCYFFFFILWGFSISFFDQVSQFFVGHFFSFVFLHLFCWFHHTFNDYPKKKNRKKKKKNHWQKEREKEVKIEDSPNSFGNGIDLNFFRIYKNNYIHKYIHK